MNFRNGERKGLIKGLTFSTIFLDFLGFMSKFLSYGELRNWF